MPKLNIEKLSRPILMFACVVLTAFASAPATCSDSRGSSVQPRQSFNFREGGSEIVVSIDDGSRAVPLNIILPWLQSAAHSIATYFHRFPVKSLFIHLSGEPGSDVGYSTANEEDGNPVIHIRIGETVSKEELKNDWVATHEMVHLAFPLVERQEDWVAEGMATYVEPMARLQAGNLSSQSYWREFMEMLPRGLPEKNDKGLNSVYPIKNTHSIRRMYWGGALFYFIADLQIRSQTHNQKGLQDAFAAIMNAGGNIESDWDAIHAFRVGDRAVGSDVLEKMYKQWAVGPVSVDLAQIWTKLGIHERGGQILFDDTAPLAVTRQAIEKGKLLQK
jgi:hypothetical protein